MINLAPLIFKRQCMIEKKMKVLEAFEEFLDAILKDSFGKDEVESNQNVGIDKILTSAEVCSHFQISATTLERRIRAGLKYSQAVKKGNRLFKLSECEDFFNINKNCHEN